MATDAVSGLPGVTDGMDDPSSEGQPSGSEALGDAVKAGAAASGALSGRPKGPKGPAKPIPPKGAASARPSETTPPSTAEIEAPSGPEIEDPGTGEEEQPAAETFTFAGQTFASREAAEAEIKRSLGIVKGSQQALTKLQKEHQDLRKLYSTLHETTLGYQRVLEAGGRQGNTPDPQKVTEPEKPWYQDPKVLDLDFAKELADEQGLDAALLYIVQQSDKVYADRLNKTLDERFAPLLQEREAAQLFKGAMDTFYSVADETGDDGQPLYPELTSGDQAVHQQIVEIWKATDRDLKLGEDGVRVAVMKYRRGVASGQIPPPAPLEETPTPAPSAPSAARVVRSIQARQAETSEALTGTGTPRPAPTGADSPAARFKAALRNAGSTVRGKDGFDFGFSAE